MKRTQFFASVLSVLMILIALTKTGHAAVGVNDTSGTKALFQSTKIKVTVRYDQVDARNSMQYVNCIRAQNGIGALTYDYDLERVAMQRAAEAAVQLSHYNAAGDNFTGCKGWSLVNQPGTSGYEYGAENLAGGNYANGEIMVRFFSEEMQASQGHRQIMLDGKYKAVGIAHAYLSWADVGRPGESACPHARDYWVQIYRTYNGNACPTAARMGRVTVTTAADKNWSRLRLTPDRLSYTLNAGETDSLPNVFMTYITARKYWELSRFELAEKVRWTIRDPAVADINGSQIKALGGGSTALEGTCGNFTVSVPITVKGVPYVPGNVAAPTLTKAVCANGSVTLTWKKVSGVAKYRLLYRKGTGNWKTLGETKSTTLRADKKLLKPGTKYSFAVRCVNGKGKLCSPCSKTKTLVYNEVYAVPRDISVSAVEDGINISWKSVAGSPKYRILYRVNGKGSWKKLAETAKLTYTWRKAKPGTKYDFTIRCVSSDGKGFASDFNKTGKSCCFLPMARISSVSVHAGTVSVAICRPKSAIKLVHTLLLYDSRNRVRGRLTLEDGQSSGRMKLPEAGFWYIRVQTEGFVKTGVGSSQWTRVENPKYRCVHRG